ncbi:AraC family transcriptional regulator [Paenibacillus methanolicus]|uniref:AraC family transcriptional regulator of arabinose operon n=1 Tax=Paenibacillus methanolicus TaxID=582686 RepID=A0A5S5CB52_9BACL|nr:AraC family transcriptional regulator [Paenibacillus methanolicus]TYP76584.1 AraC family transcriptional regulator of arabinose operon [Paenibacillus methanolicus]
MRTEVLYCGYAYHDKPLLAEDWISKEHYLIRLQTEGECRIRHQGREERLVPGDLLILRPGESYRLIVEEGESGKAGSGDYYVICRGEWLDRWWAEGPRQRRYRIYVDEDLLAIWRLIILQRRRIGEENGELVDYLLRSLCLALALAIRNAAEGNGIGKQVAAYQMKRYIERHATGMLSIEEVADHAQLSISQATRLFKAAFGETPVRYALNVRLSIALERMAYSGLTLEQVAASCGFGSYPYFYRCFMKKFGISPRQYRERNEGTE